MGKTGSVTWVKIKKRNSNEYRLVPTKWQYYKKPGPNQKYTSDGKRRRRIKRSPKSILGVKQ